MSSVTSVISGRNLHTSLNSDGYVCACTVTVRWFSIGRHGRGVHIDCCSGVTRNGNWRYHPVFFFKKWRLFFSHHPLKSDDLFSYRLVTTSTLSAFQRRLSSVLCRTNLAAKNNLIRVLPPEWCHPERSASLVHPWRHGTVDCVCVLSVLSHKWYISRSTLTSNWRYQHNGGSTDWARRTFIFTALHGMQTRSYDEISVRLSVRLSVCPSVKRVHCDKTEESNV